ncbi:MAG: DUF3566 domain-containing protein [Microbacteriaceae bacterium]|nr:DUF3566 domain-containing protein [Microbacteriaceae bacterium]
MNNQVAEQLARKTRKRTPVKQVRLKLVHLDIWAAAKFSFMLSLCGAIVTFVGTVLVYIVLLQTGVFNQLNELFGQVVGGDFNLTNIIGLPQVVLFAFVVGILNTIIGTAIGTIIAIIYNLLARVLGGFPLGFTNS